MWCIIIIIIIIIIIVVVVVVTAIMVLIYGPILSLQTFRSASCYAGYSDLQLRAEKDIYAAFEGFEGGCSRRESGRLCGLSKNGVKNKR